MENAFGSLASRFTVFLTTVNLYLESGGSFVALLRFTQLPAE